LGVNSGVGWRAHGCDFCEVRLSADKTAVQRSAVAVVCVLVGVQIAARVVRGNGKWNICVVNCAVHIRGIGIRSTVDRISTLVLTCYRITERRVDERGTASRSTVGNTVFENGTVLSSLADYVAGKRW